ncbi:ScbA/BarX family gamma-butyrolactone biosynthesis protein [Streptomyces griseus]|uniref:ScbA/BarX family gamma-butyrolactone biosynthesis protein n=1 Tax=Streptomyces griseus TaxID=1911 RepID=UPI0008405600|nr:ScbA/BarX family gamma-butyrolactone biosynthesis protein [Streptomyces griseus]
MSGGAVPDVPLCPQTPRSRAEDPVGVPKEYVHLSRADAVLISGWDRLEDGEFSLTAHWPVPQDGMPYDPRVLVQTIRQSGLAIAHAEYGVPLSHHTLLDSFDFTVAPGFSVSASPRQSCPLTVRISLAEQKKRGRSVSSLGMDIRLFHDNDLVARADCQFGWISPGAYRRLRGERLSAGWNTWPLPEPVAPRTVGRATPTDVVLAPGDRPRHWQLRNDVDNVLLFDHPVDHVPGLVLMEAAHQAAHATLHPTPFEPTTIATTFERYTEFDRPCWIEAEAVPTGAPGETAVLVTGVQDGRTVFRGRLSGPCG